MKRLYKGGLYSRKKSAQRVEVYLKAKVMNCINFRKKQLERVDFGGYCRFCYFTQPVFKCELDGKTDFFNTVNVN